MYAVILNDMGCEINVTDDFNTTAEFIKIIQGLTFEVGDKIIIKDSGSI